MKKLMLLAGLYCLQPNMYAASSGPVRNIDAPVTANERAMTHFRANFAEARDAVWVKMKDNDIYCTFRKGEVMDRVFYNSRGRWEYTLISYPPSGLVSEVKDQVLSDFEGYHITYVNEIRSRYGDPVYMINLEDCNNIKVIRYVRGESEVQLTLKKG
jgi:hypothetical protein